MRLVRLVLCALAESCEDVRLQRSNKAICGWQTGRRREYEKRVEYGAYLLEDVVEDGVVAKGGPE